MKDRWHDGCYEVRPYDLCSLCGVEYLVDDQPLLLVESGIMSPMKRDPSFLRFIPDHSRKDDLLLKEEAVIILYHADCLITRVMHAEWESNSPAGCDLCGRRFLDEAPRWAFRLKMGESDFETGIFIANDNPNHESILCADCFGKEIRTHLTDEELEETG